VTTITNKRYSMRVEKDPIPNISFGNIGMLNKRIVKRVNDTNDKAIRNGENIKPILKVSSSVIGAQIIP
jgi:hypothetical protein